MDYMKTEKPAGCIFCDFPKQNNDDARYILERGDACFVIMNLYPYNPGHMMVVPYRHTNVYESLSGAELSEMTRLTAHALSVLKRVMSPDGFNVGMNLGKAAGAGIDEHLHQHIVPRWVGDCNFMPVISDTRVVPEAMAATYKTLKSEWNI
jgi:ATP adenylyltransferase